MIWIRIIGICILYLAVTALFQFAGLYLVGFTFTEGSNPESLTTLQHLLLSLIVIVPVAVLVFLFRLTIDKKSIESMGFSLKNSGKEFLQGFVTVALIIGVGTAIILLITPSKITFSGLHFDDLLFNFLLFIIVALNEELVFRGYILNNLLVKGNKYIALCISALIFAIFHSLNPGMTFLSFANIFLAGLLLGSAYIFTKSLWFPISLHIFWNYIEGPVLGYAVSGQQTSSAFSMQVAGNDIIHGGIFGFEGSLVSGVLVLLAVVVIIYRGRKSAAVESLAEIPNA